MPLVIGGVVVTVPGQPAPPPGASMPHLQMWRQLRLNLLQFGPGMIVHAFDIFMAWASAKEDKPFKTVALAAWELHQAVSAQLGAAVVQKYIAETRRAELMDAPPSVWLAMQEDFKRQQQENPRMWGLLGKVITEPRLVHVDVPPACRRLDSLAWVIHQALLAFKEKKDPGCVAVAYTGDGKKHQFLVSTNSNAQFTTQVLQQALDAFLKDPGIKPGVVDPKLRALADLGLDRSTNFMSGPEREQLANDDVHHHLAKVMGWLADLKMDPKALVSSLTLMKGFKGINPHAEVALLIELSNTQGLSVLPATLPCTSRYDKQEALLQAQRQKGRGVLSCAKSPLYGPCYLGISYLCCQHCAYVVAAFNQWASSQRLPCVGVRGVHTVDRGGWEFFESDSHLLAAAPFKDPKTFSAFYKTQPMADLVQALKEEPKPQPMRREERDEKKQERDDKKEARRNVKEAPKPMAAAAASHPRPPPKERQAAVKSQGFSGAKNSKVYKRDRSPSPAPKL